MIGTTIVRTLASTTFIAVVLLAAALGYREIFSPDIGFHLASGRWIAEHQAWPRTDPLTFTCTHRPYVDLQWLYQLGLLALHAQGGTQALVIGNIVATLLSFALLAWRAARRMGRLSAWTALPLLLFSMGSLWEIRPHVISWLWLNLLLLALESRRWRWLPVIMLAWVNSHSLFVLGLVAIAAHGVAAWRDRQYWLWSAFAVIACLLNPYGLTGVLFPLQQWGELQGSSIFKSETLGIAEFLSPFQLGGYAASGDRVMVQPLLFMQLYAALVLVAALALGRRQRAVEALLLVLFALLFARAQKNFGYFVVATLPLVVAGMDRLAARWPRLRLEPASAALTLLLTALFGAQLASGWLYAQQRLPFRSGHRFGEQFLPVRACAFMRDTLPPGRLLNTMDSGGYVTWATGWPVFIDGRTEVAGPAFYAQYQGLRDPRVLATALRQWQIDVALVPLHFRPEWFQPLRRDPQWRCVYADEQDSVFVRQAFAPKVPTIAIVPSGTDIQIPASTQIDAVLARALPLRAPRPWESVTQHHYYPLRELRATALWLSVDQPRAAIAQGLAGLERGTIPSVDLLHNLSIAFYNAQDVPHARQCLSGIPTQRRDPQLAALLQP